MRSDTGNRRSAQRDRPSLGSGWSTVVVLGRNRHRDGESASHMDRRCLRERECAYLRNCFLRRRHDRRIGLARHPRAAVLSGRLLPFGIAAVGRLALGKTDRRLLREADERADSRPAGHTGHHEREQQTQSAPYTAHPLQSNATGRATRSFRPLSGVGMNSRILPLEKDSFRISSKCVVLSFRWLAK